MKKKGLIVLGSIVILAVSVLSGFKLNQIKLMEETIHLELGQTLDTDISSYASGNINGSEVDLSKVNVSQVGTYEAAIIKNRQNLSFMVEVVDTTPPIADTVNNLSFWTYTPIQAADLIHNIQDESEVTVTFMDGLESRSYTKGGEVKEKVVLTDSSYNQTILNTTFNIIADTTKPKIKGVKNITIYEGEEINYLQGVTAKDDRDGTITTAIKIDNSHVDMDKAGKYKASYTITDSSGNTATKKMTVTVLKDTPAVIYGVSDKTIYVDEKIDFLKGITALDDRDGDITDTIQVDQNVDWKKAGTYSIQYSVTDSSGNNTVQTMKLTIKSPVSQSTKNSSNNSKNNASKDNNKSTNEKKDNSSSGFQFFDVEPEGKMPNGDIPAGGKQDVGTWG